MDNRYDNPAQMQFINTYVPIPFEQLYTVGKQAKEDVDKALYDYSTAVNKWMEFQSPSAIDTQSWSNETIGRTKPIIDEMSKNLDLIKTPEYRAKLQSAINNVNIAKLSMLKQSAQNLSELQKNYERLALEGKYNSAWHNVNFSGYNTMQNGVFTNTSPLAYKSIRDISEPYMKDMKQGYIKTVKGMDYFGNTKSDIEQIVNSHMNDMLSTPEAQKHMQMYMQSVPNATIDDAEKWFRQEVIDSNMDRTLRPITKPNEYSLANYKANLAIDLAEKKEQARLAAKQKLAGDAGQISDEYSKMYSSSDIAVRNKLYANPAFSTTINSQNNYNNVRSKINDEITKVWIPALNNKSITKQQFNRQMTDYEKQLQAMPTVSTDTFGNDVRNLFTTVSGGIMPKIGVSNNNLKTYNEAASRVLDELTIPATGTLVPNYNKLKSNSIVNINDNDVPVSGYTIPNSKGIILASDFVNKIMKVSPNNTRLMVEDKAGMQRNFTEDLKNGRFKGIIKVPQMAVTTGDIDGSPSLIQRLEIKIPVNSVEAAGYDLKSFKKMVENNFGDSKSNLNAYVYSSSSNAKKESTLTGDYYTFDAVEVIPSTGADRQMLDQTIDKEFGGAKLQNQNYNSNTNQSYENTINTIINAMQ